MQLGHVIVVGAVVGLFKAERTHGLKVTDAARDACCRAFATEPSA